MWALPHCSCHGNIDKVATLSLQALLQPKPLLQLGALVLLLAVEHLATGFRAGFEELLKSQQGLGAPATRAP